jgi:secondary thiamine-phosphate synthase enzyme
VLRLAKGAQKHCNKITILIRSEIIASQLGYPQMKCIIFQENWDDSVQRDVVSLLNKLVPHGVWEHDRQDGNGDSHLRAGIVGPQETIPIVEGKMGLSTWQNIFLCEFDGPRAQRSIMVTVIRT